MTFSSVDSFRKKTLEKCVQNIDVIPKIKFINKNIGIFSLEEKEEIFSVLKLEFPKLSIGEQNSFISYIMDYKLTNHNNTDESEFVRSYYMKFNILVWLKDTGVTNEQIDNSINSIKEIYPHFKKRDFPDKNVVPLASGFANKKTTLTPNVFLENNIANYLNYLLTYNGNGFEQPERFEILNVMSKAIEKKFQLGIDLSLKLLEMKNYETDLWHYIFNGFSEHKINSEKFILVVDLLIPKIIENFTTEVSRILLQYSETISVNEYNQNRKTIEDLAKTIIDYSKPSEITGDISWVGKAVNSSYGVVTEAVINLIIKINENRNRADYQIDKNLKNFIERLLDTENAAESHAIINMYLPQFYVLDSGWAMEKLIPNFNSENQITFDTSWQGFLYNFQFDLDTCGILADSFMLAIKHIDKITDLQYREKFIQVYTLLCIDIVKDPLLNFIPNLFSYAFDYIDEFYRHLVDTLKTRENTEIKKTWEAWLYKFLLNRISNIPRPYNIKESYWIMLILLECTFLYDDIKAVIESMKLKIDAPNSLFYKIEQIEIDEKNERAIQLILTFCLRSIFENNNNVLDSLSKKFIENILINLADKGFELNEDLKEACSKLNIKAR